MTEMTQADLKAAVAAGIVNEAQAASIRALAARRLAGAPAADDEAFELFRGFAEIFISVGLVILMSGIMGLAAMSGDPLILSVVGIVLTMGLARYFTLGRRMVLPSIVLVCGYAMAVLGVLAWLVLRNVTFESDLRLVQMVVAGGMMAALVLWYRIFRLPFTMLLIGLTGLVLALLLAAPAGTVVLFGGQDLSGMFSLWQGSRQAVATLLFGLVVAAAGLWFDMRDPYRLGRHAASAFWLHLLAAPAIVNTLAQTALGLDGMARFLGMAVVLAVMALFALVIDRRSFLTAGLGYLAWLIWALAYQSGEGLDWPVVLILIGGAVTALGAWWVPLRARLMRALPDFPGKDRLPPYEKGVL